MSVSTPTREDFAALLEESFASQRSAEGYVAKGIVTAIEKDLAIIDVGLKVEGRVALKEFGAKVPGRHAEGRRRSRSLCRARRERARRGCSVAREGSPRRELGQARSQVRSWRARRRRHLQPGQGWLHRRPRRRRCLPAAFAGGHPSDPRRRPADEQRRSPSRSSRWTSVAATSSFRVVRFSKSRAPSSVLKSFRTSKKARLSTASSRTSPITVRSLTSAASTACCTSPTWPGAASTIRPRS
jgi:hypothetical protein